MCLAVFGNSIKNGYSLDDEFVTYNNTVVMKGLKAIPEIFTSRYVTDKEKANYGYRPIVKTTFAIENEFFGQDPHIGHLINILLYATVCFVLYQFLRKILRAHTAAFAFWITLLFLVHPFHNEVVVSLKNRDALLSLLFGLMSMNFTIDSFDQRKPLKLAGSAVFLVLAMLSKTDVLTFLFLIPFTLYFFERIELKRTVVFLAALILIFFAGKLIIGSMLEETGNKREFIFIENPLFFGGGAVERITAAFNTFGFYNIRMLVPYKLLSYYGYNTIEIGEWGGYAIAGIIAAVGIIIFVARNFIKRDPLIYGLIFFCVASSMFLNLVKPAVGIVAERFMFVPSVGFCIVAVSLLYRLFRISTSEEKSLFPPSAYSIVMVGLMLVFSVQGISRNADWKDHLTLYVNDAEKEPQSAKLHALAGAKLIQELIRTEEKDKQRIRGTVLKAVDHYKQALAVYPDYISSLNNLGMIYQSYLGKHKEAAELLSKALQLDSAYAEAWSNLGSAKMALKDTSGAISAYRNAIRYDPGMLKPYSELTTALVSRKDYAAAMQVNLDGLKIVEDGSFYLGLGKIYVHKGDTVTGISYLTKASDMDPSNKKLCTYLFTYFKKKGDSDRMLLYQNRFQTGR